MVKFTIPDLTEVADLFDHYRASDGSRDPLSVSKKIEISAKLENDVFVTKNPDSKIDVKLRFTDRSRGNSLYISDVLSFRGNVIFNGSNNTVFISNSDQKITTNIDVRGNKNTLYIGKNTSINQANLLVDGDENNLLVGDECMFSYGIRIRTSDSHAIVDLIGRKQINHSQDVVVGPRVWIASNVMVLKGTTIGEGSVIAAASVVTKPIPAVSLAAGVPARVIRKNVSWSRASLPKQAEIDRIADHFEAGGMLDALD